MGRYEKNIIKTSIIESATEKDTVNKVYYGSETTDKVEREDEKITSISEQENKAMNFLRPV